MAKDAETKHRFIILRAAGYSFNRIADELSISKATCSKWEADFEIEIAEQKADELQTLYDEYALTKKARIEQLGKVLQRLDDEIAKKDFSEMSIERLLDLRLKYGAALKEEFIDTDMNGVAPAACPSSITKELGFNMNWGGFGELSD